MEKIRKLVEKNNGWLRIDGVGLDRSIYLFGERLNVEDSKAVYNHSMGFNWGYKGASPAQLALSLALIYLEPTDAVTLHHEIEQGLIAHLPQGSFSAEINIRLTLDIITGVRGRRKNIHAFQLIRIKIGEKYYSKLLDFASMPFETCEFKYGTLEYDLLSKMTSEDVSAIKQYVSTSTKRKDPQNLKNELCTEVVGFIDIDHPKERVFVVRKGMGTGKNTGIKLDEYEYIW